MSTRTARIGATRAPEDRPAAPTLQRTLSFWEVTAGGVGIIIGAGIYVLVGAATEEAGAAVWMSFALAALLSALTGLSYAELASMFPTAGAEYDYTRRAVPGWVAFIVGWTMIAGLVVGAATVALGFGRYAAHFTGTAPWVGAYAVLMLNTAIALTGIKASAKVTFLLSLVQVGGLLLIIAVGADHVGNVDLMEAKSTAGVLGAAALVFFAFIGFDEVITLAEETRDPERIVPRALLTALGISTVLYMLVAVVAVSVLGADTLGASERPLADVMGHAVGGSAVGFVSAIAMVATMNTSLLMLTASSRLTFGMARNGALPARLAAVREETRVPAMAIIAAAAGAGAFVLFRDLALVAGVTDFAVYVVFLAVNATVVILRVRRPELPRPFRIGGTVAGVPIVPVLGFAATVLMMTQLEARPALLGLALLALGLVMAFVFGRHAR
jgi:APA family basic amino acid/polyamine antiporter